MDREDFIITVFCIVSDWIGEQKYKLRQRGPKPSLGDDEVLTMEIVGEFLGIDTDKGVHQYFKCHWNHLFPSIGHRSAFVRQAANLSQLKFNLQRNLARKLGAFDDDFHVVDGFPMPLCNFRRAGFSKLFRGEAAYGYCAAKNTTYYGFKGHLLITLNGVVTGLSLTAANADEREAALDFADDIRGTLLGDKGYIGKRTEFEKHGIDLQTPLRANMEETRPRWSLRMMGKKRRIVETVIGQLAMRFNIEKIRARDMWHLGSRVARKILAHTMGILLNKKLGRSWLDFASLIPEI